ncbi:MAG: T9SS type A sorting domain-containing protein [Bacteroidia bacterium]
MKKYFPVILFLLIFKTDAQAQNLVMNAGLENYITCPGFGQFSNAYIINWSKPTYGSTDYYNYNCPLILPLAQAPNTGDAYFGIIAYNFGTEYREYATAQLTSPLTAGWHYKVEFYVSLNDGYIQAVNEIGAYFSNTSPGPYSNSLHIPVTPQVQNTTGVLGDTAAWMLVSEIFTATGGEQYITIGNFNDDFSTTITQVGSIGSYGAYYFIDDVSVTETIEGIDENNAANVSVIPNPSGGIFMVDLKDDAGKNFEFKVFNHLGERILNFNSSSTNVKIDLTSYSTGLYFLTINSQSKNMQFKLFKL